MERPLLLLRSLFDDLKRLHPEVHDFDRDIHTIVDRVEHEGIGFLTLALSRFADSFDAALARRQFENVPGFKNKPRSSLPELFWGLTSLVFDSSTGSLKESPPVDAITSIRQVLRLFKKAKISASEAMLHAKELDSFKRKEASMLGPELWILRELRRVSSYVLRGIEENLDIMFEHLKHGPGAVFERKGGNQKWSLLLEQIEEFDLFPESGIDLMLVDRDKGILSNSALLPSERARFATVPKTVTSRRGITVEPLMKQFYQQGMNGLLRRSIERCPVLSKSLSLTDQSKNQELALAGSRTGEWATIDLSSASDLLQLEAVESAFWNQPIVFDRLNRCRSLFEDGSPMKKFAGMGNATTFPVQSIVFAMIAWIGVCDERELPVSRNSLMRVAGSVRVYGDDIIVPSDCAHRVIGYLEACGLKVNVNKTFTEGNFRESCGVDAFQGQDVTPVYYRLDPRLTAYSDSDVETLVSTSNQFWLKGYYSLANCIKANVTRQVPIGYTLRDSGAVGWICRHRTLLRTRVCDRRQAPIYRSRVSEPSKSKDKLGDYPALLKFFLTPLIARDKGHLKETVQRYSNQVRWRWVPVFPVTSDYLP